MRTLTLLVLTTFACTEAPPPAAPPPPVEAPARPTAQAWPADLAGLGQLSPGDLAATVAQEVAWSPRVGTWQEVETTFSSRQGSHLERAELIAHVLTLAGRKTRIARGDLDEAERDAVLAAWSPDVVVNDRLRATAATHAWVEVEEGGLWVTVDPLRPGALRTPTHTTSETPRAQVYVAEIVWMRDAGSGPERIAEVVAPISELVKTGVAFRHAPAWSAPDLLDKPAVPDSAGQVLGIDPSAGATSAETPLDPPKPAPTTAADPARLGPAPVDVTPAPPGTLREWLYIQVEGPDGSDAVERPIWELRAQGEVPPPWRRVDLAFATNLVTQADVQAAVAHPGFDPKGWERDLRSGDPAKVEAASRAVGIGAQATLRALFAGQDRVTTRAAAHAGVVVLPDRPRVVMALTTARTVENGVENKLILDYSMDDVNAVRERSAPEGVTRLFRAARGLGSSAWEGVLLRRMGGDAVSAAAVFSAAAAAGVEVLLASPSDSAAIDAATWIPLGDRSRMSALVRGGHQVLVPSAQVAVGESVPVAWYQIDVRNGAWVGYVEGGWKGTFELSLMQGKAGDKEAGAALGLMSGGSMAHALGSMAVLMYGEIEDEMLKEIEGLIAGMACASCPKLASKVDLDITMGGCVKASWFVDAKVGVEVKPSDFCDAYADGVRCAAALVLKDLRGDAWKPPTIEDFSTHQVGLDCDGVE